MCAPDAGARRSGSTRRQFLLGGAVAGVGAATAIGVDYALTSSCYDPGPEGRPCRGCDSCRLRAGGFAEIGAADPLLLRVGSAAP